MTNDKNPKQYDLEERTGKFGEDIIEFAKKIPLVKAGTSVGSNYCEADCAESKKDFEHKIGICKKESKESKHFLRMISKAAPELNELNLIFTTIVKNSRKNKQRKRSFKH